MKKILLCVCILWCLALTAIAQSATLTECFDAAPPASWTVKNNSNPQGNKSWFQGNRTIFNSHSGTGNSYAAANYQNTDEFGTGTISDWLISPELELADGKIVKFWTRTVNGSFPDRLEVRLSTNGASTDVGSTESSVGDFTTVLMTVNPTLTTSGYPLVWTEYQVTLLGITGTPTGRVAFRYFVPNGGGGGSNSDYIGLDDFTFEFLTLPIGILNFNLNVSDENKVKLFWKTSSELNNDHFKVERSVDGYNFSEAGQVKSKGNSTTSQSYQFVDETSANLHTSTIYYRLKQYDKDGHSSSTSILQARLKQKNEFLIRNVSVDHGRMNISFSNPVSSKIYISVLNSAGQMIVNENTESSAGENNFMYTKKVLAPGTYFVSLSNGTEKVSRPIIIQ